ncbi:hypothetical protein JOB18_044108 [Solea senegalensis]|uniref:Uncharacterized protein n=1 Tax=Solea senegalensis TaxID=28829 RepID=A0AAV6QIB3_SOLSE|nr:hypothetical protein JOB18_044108 [Solea senegalensis]
MKHSLAGWLAVCLSVFLHEAVGVYESCKFTETGHRGLGLAHPSMPATFLRSEGEEVVRKRKTVIGTGTTNNSVRMKQETKVSGVYSKSNVVYLIVRLDITLSLCAEEYIVIPVLSLTQTENCTKCIDECGSISSITLRSYD